MSLEPDAINEAMPQEQASLSRRQFVTSAAGAAVALAAGHALPWPSPARADERSAAGSGPNIVLIFTDDQGYHDLGVQGHETIRTPNIDAMAREGVRFADFYVGGSICIPSRRSLMTGCYPSRCGITSGKKPGRDSRVILPEILKRAGYTTALIGKWHLGTKPHEHPNTNGFDYYFGTHASNNMSTTLYRNTELVEKDSDNDLLTQKLTAEALGFIEKNRKSRFFLYLAHNAPHWPVGRSDAFKDRSKYAKPYGDAVEELDWSVGQVLTKLKELGLDDNTLVIYTSDNGARKQDGGSNAPFKGWKWSHYDGGQRVPCVMRWPKHMPQGKVCDEVCSSIDFLPTFATLARQPAPTDRVIDGHNMLPLMIEPEKAPSPWPVFFYYAATSKVPLAARSGPWKYDYKAGRLVRINDDPQEKVDLSDKHVKIVEQFKALRERMNASMKQQAPPNLQAVE